MLALAQLSHISKRADSAAAKAQAELAPGAWLVSLEFPLPDTQPQAQLRLPGGRRVWLYQFAAGASNA